MGRFNPLKDYLISLVKGADPSLTDIGTESHISPDWRQNIGEIRRLPHITVRFSDDDVNDEFYGRIRESGSTAESSEASITFSMHVFCSNCTVTGQAKAKYAAELADRIVTHLKKNPKYETLGLYDISDLRARESDAGPFNVSRVIVEGVLWAKRPDD